MKKVLALVLGLVLLASCSATRKATKAKESQLDSTAVVKEVTEQTEKVVDTTRTEHGKVTITEIEFYPPTTIEQPQGKLAKDSGKKVADEPKPTEPQPTPKPTASVDLDNIGKVQGVVKSIKQTVIETDVEQKGESKESSESKESENAATVLKNETNTEKQQEPTPDPYRWRYIFYIALIGVAALLYLKRVPIINWIKKILSGILKIL
jgi:hypothetical protein